jgi:hypothetical protein
VLALAVLVAVGATSACAGGQQLYSGLKTYLCLTGKPEYRPPTVVSVKHGFVFSVDYGKAHGLADIQVVFREPAFQSNWVNLLFYSSKHAADLASRQGAGPAQGNLIVGWTYKPKPFEASLIKSCLRTK